MTLRGVGLAIFATAGLAPAEPPAPDVVETRGAPVAGRVVSIDLEQGLVVEGATRVVVPFAEALSVRLSDRRAVPAPRGPKSGEVLLTDGSRFPYEAFEPAGNEVRFSLGGGAGLSAPLREIVWWRRGDWSEPPPTMDEASDVLVVRRPDGERTPLSGAVLEVTAVGVRFAVGGAEDEEPALAPWRRVAALVLFHGGPPKPGSESPAIGLRSGGRIVTPELTLVDGQFAWRRGAAPRGAAASVDLGRGRVQAVSALDLVASSWRPSHPGDADGASGGRALDAALGGGPLTLRVPDPRAPSRWPLVAVIERFERGVALRSQGELRFELPAGAGRLRGLVGCDPATRDAASAEVTVATERGALWSGVVDGDTRPIHIDAPLDGAQTLTLRVEYGENLDSGDNIHFADLRVIP